MSIKTASIISSVVTALLVFVVMIVFGFGWFILLNGAIDRYAAVITGLICLIIALTLCSRLAWSFTRTFISRFNWNAILAVIVSVFVSTLVSAVAGVVSFFFITAIVAAALSR